MHNSDLRLFHAEVAIKQVNIFFDNQLLNRIASSYIGFPTRNSGCLVNRVPPMSGDFGSGGSWHRDANFPQFKALVYLSEVQESNDGAFQYIACSNRVLPILKDSFLLGRRISNTRWTENEVQQRYSTEGIKSVLGSSGTLVLFDTSLLHRGAPNLNTSKSRYAMTNYYYPKFGSIGQYF
jgi:ectoine hydroxylase-related dioxygenase (phytanoyl-CoA dioxygenase family)